MSKFHTLNANSEIVTPSDVSPETISGGVKIATVGGKDIYAPQGGGGSAYAPFIVKAHHVGQGYGGKEVIGEFYLYGNSPSELLISYGGTPPSYADGTSIAKLTDGQTVTLFVPYDNAKAGTVYVKDFGRCLSAWTNISMSDGTLREIRDIKTGDCVMSFNPSTGRLEPDEVVYADGGENKNSDKFTRWTFDDGTTVETILRHRFFNVDLGEFMYMEAWLDGERSYASDGRVKRLVGREVVHKTIQHCTLATKRWNNYFANGMLCGNRHSVKIGTIKVGE